MKQTMFCSLWRGQTLRKPPAPKERGEKVGKVGLLFLSDVFLILFNFVIILPRSSYEITAFPQLHELHCTPHLFIARLRRNPFQFRILPPRSSAPLSQSYLIHNSSRTCTFCTFEKKRTSMGKKTTEEDCNKTTHHLFRRRLWFCAEINFDRAKHEETGK